MSRGPRKKGARMIDRDAVYFLASIGFSATVAILAVYAHMVSLGDALKAQTVLFVTFVLLEMLTVYAVRYRYGCGMSGVLSNKWLHLAVLSSILLEITVISPPLNPYFGTVPIGVGELEEIGAGLAGYAILLFIALKLEPLFIGPRKIPGNVPPSARR